MEARSRNRRVWDGERVTLVNASAQAWVFWLAVSVPGVVFLLCAGRRGDVGRLLWRLAPVAPFYAVYVFLIGWTARPGVVRLAVGNAWGIVDAERWLHVYWEPWLSRHALPGFVSFYDWGQVVVVLGVVSWLAVREGPSFWRVARNALAFICAVGFLCFWLVPVAPPWVLGGSAGIVGAGLRSLSGIGDLLGAFPSLHTAWAGWVAAVVWAVVPSAWRWLGVGNLVLTAVVVVTTGNHFLVDVVAGEALAFSACSLASLLEVRRLVRSAPATLLVPA
jgi:hypothetical protein